MVIYRLGLPYYKGFDNFQFVGAVMFFLPPTHTHLKKDAHHKAIRPLRRPEGWPPYTLPGGQLPADGTSGTPFPTTAQNKMRETADDKQSPAFIV